MASFDAKKQLRFVITLGTGKFGSSNNDQIILQAKELAQAAGIGLWIDDKVLAITQSPRTPRGTVIPLISPASGMVGYPTFDGWGVNARLLFNPAIQFGGRVKIETDVMQAAGEWVVACISHHLESEKPGGAWFSTIRCNQIGLAITGR